MFDLFDQYPERILFGSLVLVIGCFTLAIALILTKSEPMTCGVIYSTGSITYSVAGDCSDDSLQEMLRIHSETSND